MNRPGNTNATISPRMRNPCLTLLALVLSSSEIKVSGNKEVLLRLYILYKNTNKFIITMK